MSTKSVSESLIKQHPHGVYVMFFLQLFSVIGNAFIYSLLVLYAVRQLGMGDQAGYSLSGAFSSLSFSMAVFGGYIAGRYLGYRFSIGLGLVVMTVAQVILMVPTLLSLYWGLSLFTIAQGLILPCLFVALGRLYERDDPRRFSGFMIAYIGMNVGAFFAEAASGSIEFSIGFHYVFFIGAVFTLVALTIFLNFQHLYSGRGYRAKYDKQRPEAIRRSRITGFGLLLIAMPVTAILFHFTYFLHVILILLGILAVILVVNIAYHEGRSYRLKTYAFIVLTIIALSFLTLYMLIPTVLTLFVARNVDHQWLGMDIHASSFAAFNPLFVIIIGGGLSFLWRRSRGNKLTNICSVVPHRFMLGVLATGIGYLVLALGIQLTPLSSLVSSWWVVLSFLLQTIGELMIIPIGFAMIGELVPARLEGLMMGIWILASGVASSISVFISHFALSPFYLISFNVTNVVYRNAFFYYGIAAVIIAIIAFFLIPILKKMTMGVSALKQ